MVLGGVHVKVEDAQKRTIKTPGHDTPFLLLTLTTEIDVCTPHFTILQTIDWVMTVEDKFFPVISAELGNSSESAAKYQKKLKDFTPTVKVAFPHRKLQLLLFPVVCFRFLCSEFCGV